MEYKKYILKGLKIKETYLLVLIVIGLISLASYSTFALFTAETEIENVVNFNTTLQTENRMIQYEMITVPAVNTKIIEVNVTNADATSLSYGAWYQIVSPSNTEDIEVGLYTEKNSTPGSGTITSGTKLTLLVGITNDSTEEAIINIGVQGSIDQNLHLGTKRTLIPAGWTEAIIVTDEVIEANKTTITIPIPVIKTYEYTGSVIEDTLTPGTYKLEVWGAQGGTVRPRSSTGIGGLGGYSYGTLTLTEETQIFVYVGGEGSRVTNEDDIEPGGFNGGGSGILSGNYYVSSGGGASDIRIGTDSLYARVIVAGGGGGSGNYDSKNYNSGGAGGGINGLTGGQYSTSFLAGTGGTQTAGGTSYRRTTANSTSYGSLADFGIGGGGSDLSDDNIISGGGGGWYGGGYGYRSSGGGGSGYVYTESTASNYPSGCLLNASYYLTDAATVAGNVSFANVAGTGTETGHTGNGAAKVVGTREGSSYSYSVPRLLGLTDLTIVEGASVNLTDDVTLECETGESDCSLVGTEITDTASLEIGTHTIYYVVKGSDNKKYKFPREITVLKSSLTISSVLVNNNTYQGIPQTGLYSLTSNNCNNVSYDRFTKKVKISDFTQYQNCDLNFTTDTNYPKLNTMQVGDYVAYVGNNGCLNGASGTTGTGAAESGNSCKGYNANQPTDGTEDEKGRYGYCFHDNYHYTTYGWRIAYIEDNKVHLISAGSPECRTRTSSDLNATAITDLNTAALDYCNSTYVDGGTCPTTASESNAVRAFGNTDFEKITYAISGTTSSLTSVYGTTYCYDQYSYKRCGHGNDLVDNGGNYWFAAHNNSTDGVSWYPSRQHVGDGSYTYAYGFRPIIRLSSSVYVTGGSGTMTDPYTIGI